MSSWFPYSSLFPLQWPSWTPFQPVPDTSVLAKSIREHFVGHSQPGALGFPAPRCHSQALYLLRHLYCSRLHWLLDYPIHHSSLASVRRRKWIQVANSHLIRLDNTEIFGFGRHLILEFVLLGATLQTIPVAKVIFLTIETQLHHHVKRVIRKLWPSH